MSLMSMLSEDWTFSQSLSPPKGLRGQLGFLSLLPTVTWDGHSVAPQSLTPSHTALLSSSHSGPVVIHQSPEVSLFCVSAEFFRWSKQYPRLSSNMLHLQGPLNNSPPQNLYSRPRMVCVPVQVCKWCQSIDWAYARMQISYMTLHQFV